jgi:hypothetical protein
VRFAFFSAKGGRGVLGKASALRDTIVFRLEDANPDMASECAPRG